MSYLGGIALSGVVASSTQVDGKNMWVVDETTGNVSRIDKKTVVTSLIFQPLINPHSLS